MTFALIVHGAGALTGLTAAEVDVLVKRLADDDIKRLQTREAYMDSGPSFRVVKEQRT